MKTPKLEDLIKRYVKCIRNRHPDQKIDNAGIEFLTNQWKGQEEKLYKIVKDWELKNVKTNNLNKRFERVSVTYNTGVDVLGFPLYTTHETLFQIDIDRKYAQNTTNWQIVDSIQYEHK